MTSDDETATSPPDMDTTAAAPSCDSVLTAVKEESDATRAAGADTSGATCQNSYCYAPDTPCHLGSPKLATCENWQPAESSVHADTDDDYRPPWSGLALGSVDLSAIAATRRARIVALVGATNAGKTSALLAYFAQLRRGHSVDGMRFAGSFTLLGWDEIARHAEFPPGGARSFPPHTTSPDFS